MASSSRPAPPKPAKPGLSPGNRSLERGIEILRAWRPGTQSLGNAELAERTGLPRATVTRLTQTLAGSGLLEPDGASRGWRLAPAVLSLAHAMRSGSPLLAAAAPCMRAAAEAHRVNAGLAAPDLDEMVYLESFRYNRRPSLRTVVSGQRVPIELTSLGRAYLASAPEPQRKALLVHLRRARGAGWRELGPAIERAIADVQQNGWCAAAWQAEVVAVATPLVVGQARYALNVSLSTPEPPASVAGELAQVLMGLKDEIVRRLERSGAMPPPA